MKFKELPEGHYFIHAVAGSVSVEKLESPESKPSYIVAMTKQVVHDGREYVHRDEVINEMEVEFKTQEDMRKERKSYGARISHITRRLNAREPLSGKSLKLALSLLTSDDPEAGINRDPFYQQIAKKLKAGIPLDDYETHMMVDVRLVYERLG